MQCPLYPPPKETFGEAVAAYLKAKASELRPRTLTEVERYLDDYSGPLTDQRRDARHPRRAAAPQG